MNDRRAQLEDALRSIPDGVCSIQILETGLPPIRSVTVRTEGKGCMTAATIFPGIELSYWQILAPTVSFRHEALHDAIEVTFCRSGRAGWNLTKGFVSYVGAGATAAHMMDCCADSAMSLPLGYFEGAGLAVDFRALNGTPADIIASAGTTAEKLIEKYGAAPVVFPPNQELERLFSSLYDTPEPYRPAACKIAALELLLYLVRADIDAPAAQQSCDAQLASVVQDIHAVMTANLDKRYTIDELAKTYFINTSSLKNDLQSRLRPAHRRLHAILPNPPGYGAPAADGRLHRRDCRRRRLRNAGKIHQGLQGSDAASSPRLQKNIPKGSSLKPFRKQRRPCLVRPLRTDAAWSFTIFYRTQFTNNSFSILFLQYALLFHQPFGEIPDLPYIPLLCRHVSLVHDRNHDKPAPYRHQLSRP